MDSRGIPATDALSVLASRLNLDDGFTLRGFVRMLQRYPELQRLSSFAPDLVVRHGQAEPEPAAESGLERLEFSRVVELIGAPGPPRLEVYHIIRGCVAGDDDLEIRGWQVENILDVPIQLGALRHVVFGDNVHAYRFETVCTLFDFIDGVVWQLAFHGAPQECALRR